MNFPAGVSERHVRHGALPPHLNTRAGLCALQQRLQGQPVLNNVSKVGGIDLAGIEADAAAAVAVPDLHAGIATGAVARYG